MVCIQQLQLYQFRCFSQLHLTLGAPVIFLTGANGSGKTTILEALVYSSCAHSFRNASPKELIAHGKSVSALQVSYILPDETCSRVHITLAQTRRAVRLDGKLVAASNENWRLARVVPITEYDNALVQGGPESRRFFLDQAIIAYDYHYYETVRSYRKTLEQRNRLLFLGGNFDEECFWVWTQKLVLLSNVIRQRRRLVLNHLFEQVELLLKHTPLALPSIKITYVAHRIHEESAEELFKNHPYLRVREKEAQRTLFGAHLDDLCLELNGHGARLFASRGQQRILVILLKLAVARFLLNESQRVILVLDDVMADFDKQHLEQLMCVLFNLKCQLIVSSAYPSGALMNALGSSCLSIDLDTVTNQSCGLLDKNIHNNVF